MKSWFKASSLAVALAMLFLFCPGSCPAQEKSKAKDETVLEEVVVTGTRSERAVEDVVAEVETISQEEIGLAPVTTWDDMLKYTPGIKVHRPDGIGHRVPMALHIRGISGSRQNLILLDGLPINEPETGFIAMYSVPPEMIRRIEVVKGAYSSLYGSYAMGGVINLISARAPSEEWTISPYGKLGDYGYWEAGVRMAKDFGDVDVALGYKHREADNYLRLEKEWRDVYDPDTGVTTEEEFDVENRDLRAEYADLRVGWKINPSNELHLTAVLMNDHQGGGVATYLTGIEPYGDETNLHVGLKTIHRLRENWTLTLAAYTNSNWSKDLKEEMDMSSLGKTRYYPEDKRGFATELGFQAQVVKNLAQWSVLTLGVDTAYNYASWDRKDLETGEQVIDTSADLYNIAPYVQMELFFLDGDLIVTPGLRGDFHSETDSAVSPKLAVRYNLDQFWSIRASGGRSFRAPSVNELFGPTWMMISGIPFMANPDLKPEHLWTTDLGLSYDSRGLFRANVSGFYTRGYDFIEAQISSGIQQYVNVDDVEIYGVEMDADLQLTEWLRIFAGYAYTHTEDLGSGDPLANTPEHSIKAGIHLSKTYGAFTLGAYLTGNFEFNRPHWIGMGTSGDLLYDDTTLVDAGVTLGHSSGWNVGLKSTNIFDAEWYSHGTTPGAGRAVWVEVSHNFVL